MGLLAGKVVLITGAAGAIGRSTALLLAREGAALVVNDLGTGPDGTGCDGAPAAALAEELRATGARVEPSADDVASADGAARAVALALERFGRLDALVCSAGAALDRPLLELDLRGWKRVLDVHLDAAFLCIRHAAAHMIERGEGGRIVTVTGLGGLYGAFGQSNHAAAMAGIYGLTRAAAIELQRHGITVNAVAPLAATRLTAAQPQVQGVPELSAEHVAPVALFFACELCRARSGEVLGVGGGRVYRLKVVESKGQFKQGDVPWTAEELAEQWEAITKL
jgi:NAD(P)-dependent dehydrogenase (short-subunit alcohol dehydrogenase family)